MTKLVVEEVLPTVLRELLRCTAATLQRTLRNDELILTLSLISLIIASFTSDCRDGIGLLRSQIGDDF